MMPARQWALAGVLIWVHLPGHAAPAAATIDEFRLIAQAHQALSRYSLQIDVAMSDGAAPLRADVQCLEPERCIRAVGNLTIIQASAWTIAVDRARRALIIASRNRDSNAAPSYLDPGLALTAWLDSGATLLEGQAAMGLRHWFLKPAKPQQPTGEMFTDTETHLLRRIAYWHSEKPKQRIEIVYTWRDAASVDPTRFEDSSYITVEGGSIRPASVYEGYRVIRADPP